MIDRLPNQVIIYMALNMDLDELLSFCLSSKRFNNVVCKNNYFWLRRLIDDHDVVSAEEIPRGYTPKAYYEYLTNNLPGFFIPTYEGRCEDSVYLEPIFSNDFIVAYGVPGKYVCYTLDELVGIMPDPDSIQLTDRDLEKLKIILQGSSYGKNKQNKQKRLIVGFIDKALRGRNIDLVRLQKLINPANKDRVVEALKTVLEAANHDTEDRVGLSRKYTRANEMLLGLDPEITKNLYASEEKTVTLSETITQVLRGTYCLQEAKRKLSRAAKKYLKMLFGIYE